MNLFSIIWLGLVILLGFLEALTVTLTSIWFAVGALAAMAVALFGGALWVQILVFAVVSLICVLALRPLAKTRLGGAKKGRHQRRPHQRPESGGHRTHRQCSRHRRRVHWGYGVDCPQRQRKTDCRRQRGPHTAHRRRQGIGCSCFRSFVTVSPCIPPA